MGPAPQPTTASGGFDPLDAVRILRLAGGTLFSQARLHGQLAGVEWEEEKNRLLKMLAAALLGFACLLCTLLFAGAVAVAATWDTPYRLVTLGALVVLFACGTGAAWRRFAALSALASQSFAASRAEFAADAAVLKAST